MKIAIILWFWLISPADAKWRSGAIDPPIGGLSQPRIAIRLVSSVVPVKSMLQAERIAGEIFAKAGVELLWLDCNAKGPCGQEAGPADLRLQILPRMPSTFHGDLGGFAVLTPQWREGESYAAVAYPVVEATANSLEVELPGVLGAILAHEIGHLLLGASHSASGVMSPRFRGKDLRMAARGELLFTSELAIRIRTEAARRLAAR